MSKYIDVDRLKAEIDKRYTEYRAKMKTDDFTYYEGMADALDLFEQFLDTISEQPVVKKSNALFEECLANVDPAIRKEVSDNIDKMLRRQPVEGLEEEMEKFFETMPVLEHENIFEDTFKNIASHFAEWQKAKMMEKAVDGRYMKAVGKVYVESWPLDLEPDSVKAGDEVKLIVIPKE